MLSNCFKIPDYCDKRVRRYSRGSGKWVRRRKMKTRKENLTLDSYYQFEGQNLAHQLIAFRTVLGEIPNQVKGRLTLDFSSLKKRLNYNNLGVAISGGADFDYPAKITYILPGGLAAKSDLLQLNDIVTTVNGRKTNRLNNLDIVDNLENSSEDMRLEIEYELPPAYLGTATPGIEMRLFKLFLLRDEISFGFTIRGGQNSEDSKKSRKLVVTAVRPNSPAETCAILKPGDRLVEINGHDLKDSTLEQALKILETIPNRSEFIIEYDVSIPSENDNFQETSSTSSASWQNGYTTVEVYKTPNVELGLNLTLGANGMVVQDVLPASVSERSGSFQVGDLLLKIDNVDTQFMTVFEALKIFRSPQELVTIELFRPSQQIESESNKTENSASM